MNNPIIKAAAGRFGKGIQSLAVEQSVAKIPEIPLNLLTIKKQVRVEFEDDAHPLSELADDIKTRGVLQPILVRPVQGGKYELVAGERRYRAAKMAGLEAIPALVKPMTDEEAAEAQFIENIKRKNLTLQEEAQRIQRDLDTCGGDIAAVLKKYGKPKSGRAWIYKMRGLLNLSEQAQRLISENITADIEVINDIRQIEKINPEKARETVDRLEEANAAKSGNMREISRGAKAEVAPTKRQVAKKDNKKVKENQATSSSNQLNNEARDDILQVDDEVSRAALEKTLRAFFDKGANTVEWVAAVSEGIRQGDYTHSSMGRLKLAALSAGFAKSDNFNLDGLIDKAKHL
ncbi:nucleoid occlusion protein (plasmid) [Nitrosomonas stercoris]|uniref:Nucleoid occlusion protein n=1 Tax=Nitrosomonas stercoris TaxID=1444684 RepID=A0A4Y1YS92_9PROT|nr:nucleoid occlusion protein [Nitrosomonas stercoris]